MNRPEKYFLKTSRSGFRQWCQDDISDAIGLWETMRLQLVLMPVANFPILILIQKLQHSVGFF
jgi:hypothetical protein